MSPCIQECSICLTSIVGQNDFTMSRCSHAFHSTCIFKHLENSIQCPICRSPLYENICNQEISQSIRVSSRVVDQLSRHNIEIPEHVLNGTSIFGNGPDRVRDWWAAQGDFTSSDEDSDEETEWGTDSSDDSSVESETSETGDVNEIVVVDTDE